MFNKHFFKTLLLFIIIVLIGLIGLWLIDEYEDNKSNNNTAIIDKIN